KNNAGNKVVEDILQSETNPDTQCTKYNGQLIHRYPQRRNTYQKPDHNDHQSQQGYFGTRMCHRIVKILSRGISEEQRYIFLEPVSKTDDEHKCDHIAPGETDVTHGM